MLFLGGKPLSSAHISMELSTPEPSVSLHLATQTQAAQGITAVTSHHSIKDFSVSCRAEAGERGGTGRYFLPLSFLPFLPFFMETLVYLHIEDLKSTN